MTPKDLRTVAAALSAPLRASLPALGFAPGPVLVVCRPSGEWRHRNAPALSVRPDRHTLADAIRQVLYGEERGYTLTPEGQALYDLARGGAA